MAILNADPGTIRAVRAFLEDDVDDTAAANLASFKTHYATAADPATKEIKLIGVPDIARTANDVTYVLTGEDAERVSGGPARASSVVITFPMSKPNAADQGSVLAAKDPGDTYGLGFLVTVGAGDTQTEVAIEFGGTITLIDEILGDDASVNRFQATLSVATRRRHVA